MVFVRVCSLQIQDLYSWSNFLNNLLTYFPCIDEFMFTIFIKMTNILSVYLLFFKSIFFRPYSHKCFRYTGWINENITRKRLFIFFYFCDRCTFQSVPLSKTKIPQRFFASKNICFVCDPNGSVMTCLTGQNWFLLRSNNPPYF